MSAACSEACGFCGGCTAAWEREREPRAEFHCIACDRLCDLDDFEPFCSETCRQNYNGPTDDPDAWSGGFAPNH